MQRITAEIYEIVTGAVLLGLGLLYLTYRSNLADRYVAAVENEILENGDLYQEYSTVDLNLISSNELYAIIMGNREFPVIIDGNIIETDGNDYETYFSYIKEGYYRKTYNYDEKHNIKQIVFTYSAS